MREGKIWAAILKADSAGKTSAPGLGRLPKRLVRPIGLARGRRSPNDLPTEISEAMCEARARRRLVRARARRAWGGICV